MVALASPTMPRVSSDFCARRRVVGSTVSFFTATAGFEADRADVGSRDEREITLRGGNLRPVVRVGDTVRRHVGAWTPVVHSVLRHLENVGFRGAPRVLGIDERGREILEYIPGTIAWGLAHRRLLGNRESLKRAGRLLRSYHDAITGFVSPTDAVWQLPELERDADRFADERGKLVCHNDATAWNLVCGEDGWAFIDWDVLCPAPFIWDIAFSAISMVPIAEDAVALGWPAEVPAGARLVAFADGYGLLERDRAQLPEAIVARIRSMYETLQRRSQSGEEPYVTLWKEGHGTAWASLLAFAEKQYDTWVEALAGRT